MATQHICWRTQEWGGYCAGAVKGSYPHVKIVEYGVLLVILTESVCVLWEEGGGYSSVISCQQSLHEDKTLWLRQHNNLPILVFFNKYVRPIVTPSLILLQHCGRACQISSIQEITLRQRMNSLKIDIMSRNYGHSIQGVNVYQPLIQLQKGGRIILQRKAVDIHFDTLIWIGKFYQLSLLLVCQFDKLTPSRKVLASIGVTTSNALDEFRPSTSLFKLEALDGFAFAGAPESNSIVRYSTPTVNEHEFPAWIWFVHQVTAFRAVVIILSVDFPSIILAQFDSVCESTVCPISNKNKQ